MTPIIEVSDEAIKMLNPQMYKRRADLEKQKTQTASFDKDNFIYVPSIKLYVAKQRTHQGKNWFEAHKELQSKGLRMPTIPEFREFLKYARENNQDVYKDITEVKSPWRAEWLDADFKVKNGKLYINSNHVLDSKGNLVPQNSEPLDKNTLMQDKTPGISLENWINSSHTRQGLPSQKVKKGDLYYWCPDKDNNSVAGFDVDVDGAYLVCGRNPSARSSVLEVRAVKHE